MFRRVLSDGRKDYDLFVNSGLKDHLISKGWIVNFEEVSDISKPDTVLLKPEVIPFISYPYEWSFSQYRSAALATLRLQKTAMKYGMTLKDASAYNIQFVDGKPVLIDTLSFEEYNEGEPWIAYKQFCQHFLAPLALASKVDIELLKLMRLYIDGVPLELASNMLPRKTRFNGVLATHIHWHAKTQKKHSDNTSVKGKANGKVTERGMLGLIDHLYSGIKKLKWSPKGTEWGDYYTFTNYSDNSFDQKKQQVQDLIKEVAPSTLWDLGANDGTFSRIAADMGIPTVAFDIDPIAVEKNYKRIRQENSKNLLPLRLDLTNPSPAIGWASEERDSIEERGPAGCVMALALIHHLAISNNLPLERIAKYFAKLGDYLIIEFVPKEDSQVQKLLATREDIFPDYNEQGFETAFYSHFELIRKQPIAGTKRTMYLYHKAN